ncbi:MAG TPA: TfoX/Sxy family protein [Methanomassiliicoccales archaeon]|jgi:TfoX/Sxy family transcriptional regulator of competence genes|nr:TfoX/Sxy family protein [Methanomassiliicoccales archaeon]
MKWKKAPSDLVEFLSQRMKDVPCEPRQMFGFPSYFINGNMFVGAFEDRLFLRLSESDRAAIAKTDPRVRAFEPMPGRQMGEYVEVPKSLYTDKKFFDIWLDRSIRYASSLPAKKKAPKK